MAISRAFNPTLVQFKQTTTVCALTLRIGFQSYLSPIQTPSPSPRWYVFSSFQSYLSPIQTRGRGPDHNPTGGFQSYLSPIQTWAGFWASISGPSFQSYLSPIQTEISPLVPGAWFMAFNPTLVQFKPDVDPSSQVSPNPFNPTLVQFKLSRRDTLTRSRRLSILP